MALLPACSASRRTTNRARLECSAAETRPRCSVVSRDPYGFPGSALEAERFELLDAILESLERAPSAQIPPVHRRLLAHLARPQRISFPRQPAPR